MADHSDYVAPTQRLGEEAMALAEHIVDTYGADAMIGTCCIVVDVTVPQADGEPLNPITFGCSDTRRWVQVALLQEGLDRAEEDNAKLFDIHTGESDDDDE